MDMCRSWSGWFASPLVEMEEELHLGAKQNLDVCGALVLFSLRNPKKLTYFPSLSSNTHSPGLLNSLAGLLSTLSSVYGAQHGQLVKTSKVTLIVTAASTGVFGILTGVYLLWLVGRVKRKHDRAVGKQKAGRFGEGVVDLSTRSV